MQILDKKKVITGSYINIEAQQYILLSISSVLSKIYFFVCLHNFFLFTQFDVEAFNKRVIRFQFI